MDTIAEERIDLLYPDGELVAVTIRIGRPQPDSQGPTAWSCAVQAEGMRMFQGPTNIFGEGSMHALMLGTAFIHRMLSYEIKNGAVPHYSGGEGIRDIDLLFARNLMG